jgi:nickel transport protein
MGHTSHWVIGAEELGIAATPPAVEPNTALVERGATVSTDLDVDTIREIVEQTMEKKLAPLRRQMTRQNWGLRDIVAGIGYIIGLMGLASYMHYRKER